jgi:hypothetical protein
VSTNRNSNDEVIMRGKKLKKWMASGKTKKTCFLFKNKVFVGYWKVDGK